MSDDAKPVKKRARTNGLYRLHPDGPWYIRIRWMGWPRLRLSTHTTSKTRALSMKRTLESLRDAGRRDLLGLLVGTEQGRRTKAKLRLVDVHTAFLADPASLDHLAKPESPVLGPLVDRWLAWLPTPSALSTRTRRPFAPRTIERYSHSWQRIFAVLTNGRESRLDDLTKGFLATYRTERKNAGVAPATVNRDFCALGAFWSWCQEEGIAFQRIDVAKEAESAGRERWLSADEIKALQGALPPEWWPFVAVLIYTGLRWGEAAGLVWGDVRLVERRIAVSDRVRRLKNTGSNRIVPVSTTLAKVLAEYRTRYPGGPADAVFSAPFDDYDAARHVFRRACLAAGLHDGGRNKARKPKPNCTMHDLRHTFGVHAARAGVPIARLQKLLGHKSPIMTMRYLQHDPANFMDEDAINYDASLTGAMDRDENAAAKILREGIRRV